MSALARIVVLVIVLQAPLFLLYSLWVPALIAAVLVGASDLLVAAMLAYRFRVALVDIMAERRDRPKSDIWAPYLNSPDPEVARTAELLRTARDGLAESLDDYWQKHRQGGPRNPSLMERFKQRRYPYEKVGFVFVSSKESYLFIRRSHLTDPDLGLAIEHVETLAYTYEGRRLIIDAQSRPCLWRKPNAPRYPATPAGWRNLLFDIRGY